MTGKENEGRGDFGGLAGSFEGHVAAEFGDVLLILPDELSAIMSRELIYTGVTRAMRRVELWGTETVFVEAVKRQLTRASALQERLWGTVGEP